MSSADVIVPMRRRVLLDGTVVESKVDSSGADASTVRVVERVSTAYSPSPVAVYGRPPSQAYGIVTPSDVSSVRVRYASIPSHVPASQSLGSLGTTVVERTMASGSRDATVSTDGAAVRRLYESPQASPQLRQAAYEYNPTRWLGYLDPAKPDPRLRETTRGGVWVGRTKQGGIVPGFPGATDAPRYVYTGPMETVPLRQMTTMVHVPVRVEQFSKPTRTVESSVTVGPPLPVKILHEARPGSSTKRILETQPLGTHFRASLAYDHSSPLKAESATTAAAK
eukprot:EG_transcript_14041